MTDAPLFLPCQELTDKPVVAVDRIPGLLPIVHIQDDFDFMVSSGGLSRIARECQSHHCTNPAWARGLTIWTMCGSASRYGLDHTRHNTQKTARKGNLLYAHASNGFYFPGVFG